MMEVVASAPGKQVLLGDYAVLEGAPALVLAVNRRAEARIVSRDDGICEVHAPDLDVRAARLTMAGDGALRWLCDDATAAKLTLVEHVWQGLHDEGLASPALGSSGKTGFSLHLDTAGFFFNDAHPRIKLGLGSSAALTVALASALASYAGHGEVLGEPLSWTRRLLHMHSRWQSGRGSGVDIAAAVAGGLIHYQLAGVDQVPSFAHAAWPVPGVHWSFVWSGQTVSTSHSLQHLAEWRRTHETDYAAHMTQLGHIAMAAIDAWQRKKAESFIGLTNDYAMALRNFGDACGLDIYSPAQKRLAELAVRANVSFKPCGAGGDFGVVFADDPERLATFEAAIVATGMQVVPLPLESQGMRCHMRQT